jgi:hypothetical protein
VRLIPTIRRRRAQQGKGILHDAVTLHTNGMDVVLLRSLEAFVAEQVGRNADLMRSNVDALDHGAVTEEVGPDLCFECIPCAQLDLCPDPFRGEPLSPPGGATSGDAFRPVGHAEAAGSGGDPGAFCFCTGILAHRALAEHDRVGEIPPAGLRVKRFLTVSIAETASSSHVATNLRRLRATARS